MFQCKIRYKCKVCNGENFYAIPADEKVKSGDIVSSLNKFIIECKICGQKYLLSFNVGLI